MTDVTQLGMWVTLLCSLHEAFWLVWWMEQNYAPGDLQNIGCVEKLLTGKGRRIFLTLGYGILWYGMREQLSCIPALLFFTISFCLLWECEGNDSFLYAAGCLFGLEVTLWFTGRLPQYGTHIGQAVWLGGNLIAARLRRHRRIQKKDLCALFANLTENALEAAKSRICFTTRTVPGMLLLEIENDYREKPELSEGHLQKKKADSTRHGWGLRIVEQIVKKYEGQINYEIAEETGGFQVRVWLNL